MTVPTNQGQNRFLNAELGVFDAAELDQLDAAAKLFLPLIDQ